MRIVLFLLCVAFLLIPVGCGSTLKEDTILSPSYYARHGQKILEDCHLFRIDIDRVIFGLEDAPIDEW